MNKNDSQNGKEVSSDVVLPCPFCGSVDIVFRWAGNIEIKHKDGCFFRVNTALYGDSYIESWNRRFR
jgi:hypothetical protein